jgi:hypothetical protein
MTLVKRVKSHWWIAEAKFRGHHGMAFGRTRRDAWIKITQWMKEIEAA